MPMQQVQNYLQQEMQSFQNRLQRGAMECQDRARDEAGANPNENQIQKVQTKMEKCVTKCVETHIGLLPTIQKRVEEAVAQVTKQQ
jgi:hypothetical protein